MSSGSGKTCALVTAGLLVACGIVVLVFAMMHLDLPATLVEDTCTKSMAGVVRAFVAARTAKSDTLRLGQTSP
jgi:hypothetical protein